MAAADADSNLNVRDKGAKRAAVCDWDEAVARPNLRLRPREDTATPNQPNTETPMADLERDRARKRRHLA